MSKQQHKEKKTANTIALLVSNKSTLRVKQFVELNWEAFQEFNIIATLTEGKELESVKGLNIQYISSLESGGCAELAQRVKKGQITAVFVINPGAVFTVDFKIQPLLDACWLSDTHICFNLENIDIIFSQIAGNKDKSVGTKKLKTEQISPKALLTLQNQVPGFDKPLDVKEAAKRKAFVENVQCSQLEYLFNVVDCTFLPMSQLFSLFINRENANKEKNISPLEVSGMGKYFEINPSGFLRLKACPIDWGVKFLTLGPGADIRKFWDYETFKRDFLITYPVFISPVDLVRGLRHFFFLPQPDGLNEDEHGDLKPASTVIKLVNDWILMEYGTDFRDNEDLTKELETFIKDDITKYDANIGGDLQKLLHAALNVDLPFPLSSEKEKLAPKSNIPKKLKFDESSPFFTVASPQEVARQMTLLDESYFQKILAREFLGGAWTKSYAMVKAPNLTKFINHTNRTANFVVTEILAQRTLQNIAEYITFWIKVGEQFQILKNYNGVMNILTALHSSTIGRIKNAWSEVKQQDIESFENMTESLSLLGHFKNYREELKKIEDPITGGPVIPLIAVTCSDLNGLGEVLENKTEEGWINFDKQQKIGEHIWSVKRLMRGRYNFRVVPEIKNYIEKAEVWSPAEFGEKTLSIIAKYRNEYCSKEEVIKAEKDRHVIQQERQIPIHAMDLNDKDWDLIHSLKFSSKLTATKYSKGDIIDEVGVPINFLKRIKKGTVRGEITDFQQKALVATYSKDVNCHFGYFGYILSDALCTFNFVAEENCEIYKYDFGPISKEALSNHSFGEKLHKIMFAKLCDKLSKFGTTPDSQLVNKKLPIFLTQQQKNDDRIALLSISQRDFTENSQRNSQLDLFNKSNNNKPSFMNKKDSSNSLKVNEKGPGTPNNLDTKERKKRFQNKGSDNEEFEIERISLNSYDCVFKNYVGKLVITKTNISFVASAFGKRVNLVFKVASMVNVIDDERDDVITITFGEGPLNETPDIVFHSFRYLHQEAFEKLSGLVKDKENFQLPEEPAPVETPEDADFVTLEKDEKNLRDCDWDILLEASKPILYDPNTIIIRQDEEQKQRIYYIGSGSCRVEKELDNGQIVQVETLQAGSIFGETSFLNGVGSKACSTIIAEEETFITIIDGFFLDILFDYIPGLCSRFYFYLASDIFKRLKNKYKAMNSSIPTLQKGTNAQEELLQIISSKEVQETPRPKMTAKFDTQQRGASKSSKSEFTGQPDQKVGGKKLGSHKTGSSSKFGSMRDKKGKEKPERVVLLTAENKNPKIKKEREEKREQNDSVCISAVDEVSTEIDRSTNDEEDECISAVVITEKETSTSLSETELEINKVQAIEEIKKIEQEIMKELENEETKL